MKHHPTPMPSPYWSEPETTLHIEGAFALALICLVAVIVERFFSTMTTGNLDWLF